MNNGNSQQKELFDFAYEVYYKAISLIKLDDGKQVINIDDEILKDVIINYLTLHSNGFGGESS